METFHGVIFTPGAEVGPEEERELRRSQAGGLKVNEHGARISRAPVGWVVHHSEQKKTATCVRPALSSNRRSPEVNCDVTLAGEQNTEDLLLTASGMNSTFEKKLLNAYASGRSSRRR